jgi:SAM-dependent methyltransferase
LVPDATSAGTAYSRRISSEIGVFARQGPLHRLSGIADWRIETFLNPPLREISGHASVAAIYATTIAAAIERSGTDTVFALGCGDGEQEIAVLRAADQLGLPRFRINGWELSPISLARARSAAEAAGLSERFIVVEHDLNQGLPSGKTPAAVMAHHVLHHIVALEPLFDNVAECLHPEGVLVSFDMIGRNGHMLWQEVRPLVRRLWAMLPLEKRHDHVFHRILPDYQDWDCSIEGFEGVRAQDILRLLAERFDPEALVVWGGISQVFIGDRVGPNFNPDDATDRAFIAAVQRLESVLLAARQTTPTEMYGVFRSRRGKFRPRSEVVERLTRSIRLPGEEFAPIPDPGFRSPFPPARSARLPILAHDTVHPVAQGSPAAAALREGWEAPEDGGAWAILDEQSIMFRLDRACAFIDLHIWNPCPTAHQQTLRAVTPEGECAEVGPLAEGDLAVLRIRSKGSPRTHWDIRINSSAYRRPEQEGLMDQRPLAWRLTQISAGGCAESKSSRKFGAVLRAVRRLGRR